MIAQSNGATLAGIEALPVVVEVDLQGSVSKFVLVGLPDKAVIESQERVLAAIENSDLTFPRTRIVCNLAPADTKKEGPLLDLPIAVAVLAVSGQVPLSELEDTLFMGELGLDGALRRVDGSVNVALLARRMGFRRLVVPTANAPEAAVVKELEVYGLDNLLQVVELLNGSLDFSPVSPENASRPEVSYELDFADVKGQKLAARALEIAAAGGHNVLMTGPPGSGKTMLARRLPTIMPNLSIDEAIEVTQIYSSSGNMGGHVGLIWERPFRSPHHTTSYAALVGGGKNPKPGEVSLSHLGVLFLDEMPEFDRDVLEALRQPLEDGVVSVSRVSASMDFPAECILVGAMNPCPCGFKGYPEAKCVGAAQCERYAAKLSGPLVDRIDIHVNVPRLKPEELTGQPNGESSAVIRERVASARASQSRRLGADRLNARMTPRQIKDHVGLVTEAEEFMGIAASRLNLSARTFDRILKVSRTIADLAGSEKVMKPHLAEAVQFRSNTG